MSRRRINGFLSLNRAGLRSLDCDYGLTVGARYVYVHLVSDADHHDGTMVISVNAWAEEVNLERKSVRRWLRKLSDEGLVVWIPARNQDIPGQLIIPDYDWFTAYADAVPPGTRRGHAGDMLGANDPGTLPPTSEKEALSIQAFKHSSTTSKPMRKSREKRRDIARVEDTEESEAKASPKTEPPKTETLRLRQVVKDTRTPEEKRALLDDPDFLLQLEAEEQRRHEAEANEA